MSLIVAIGQYVLLGFAVIERYWYRQSMFRRQILSVARIR